MLKCQKTQDVSIERLKAMSKSSVNRINNRILEIENELQYIRNCDHLYPNILGRRKSVLTSELVVLTQLLTLNEMNAEAEAQAEAECHKGLI